jgi:hypothetical protein
MSYHHDHDHTQTMRAGLRPAMSPQTYAAVVGTVEQSTERPITGRSGDHLQFYLDIGAGTRYQVDVNTQSSDGSAIGVYVADQDLAPAGTNPAEPFGPQAYGVFPNAKLSYAAIGLADGDFTPVNYYRIDSMLQAALSGSTFVSVYGMTFDDGGADGKGVHDVHFNAGDASEDGAVLIYASGAGGPKRTWFFFKFQDDTIGGA